MSIYFIRHGEVANPDDVYYGRMPRMGLSQKGRSQAQVAADVLRNEAIAAVFTSPLLRARQTARIILTQHNYSVLRTSGLLNEAHTPFDGSQRDVIVARHWDVYSGTKPPYEQPADVLKRTLRFLNRVRKQYPKQSVVAVTHGDVIAFLILWAKSMPITSAQKTAFNIPGLPNSYPSPGSISTFTFYSTDDDERPSLEYLNPNAR